MKFITFDFGVDSNGNNVKGKISEKKAADINSKIPGVVNALDNNDDKVKDRDTHPDQTSFNKKNEFEGVEKWVGPDGNVIDENPDKCNNCTLYFKDDYVPQKNNPPKPLRTKDTNDDSDSTQKNDKMEWKEIVAYYQPWDGSIPFNEDGVPDLKAVSKGNVIIGKTLYGKNILSNPRRTDKNGNLVGDDGRDENFLAADIALARQKFGDPVTAEKTAAVKSWREKNGYTWHEMNEVGEMQKVPSAVHGAVYHAGGVSMFKQLYAEGKLEGIDFNSTNGRRGKNNLINKNA